MRAAAAARKAGPARRARADQRRARAAPRKAVAAAPPAARKPAAAAAPPARPARPARRAPPAERRRSRRLRPALIGVGYGGIRIVSRDGGKTWGDRAYETTNGGDDDVLLRAVVYGKGIWVATGWKLWTSTDGIKWTDHGKLRDGPVKSCAIIEGLAYKDGTFYGVCDGKVFRSTDALTWTMHSTIPNTGSHVYLIYRGGKFVAYGDTKTSYQSDDALTWMVMSGIEQATYCNDTWKSQADCKDSSWYDGAFLRADWQGKISRSTNGTSFTTVYNNDQQNTLYQSRAIAAGFVAPK